MCKLLGGGTAPVPPPPYSYGPAITGKAQVRLWGVAGLSGQILVVTSGIYTYLSEMFRHFRLNIRQFENVILIF